MKHIFSFRNRTTRAVATAAAGLLLLTGTAAASSAAMRDLGAANIQGGGFWGIEATVRDNPAASGLTFARVTSGSCTTTSPSALVFETYLSETETGDGSYRGELYPVSTAAEALVEVSGVEGQVVFEPVDDGTHVAAYLQIEGLPYGRNLRLCLGTGE